MSLGRGEAGMEASSGPRRRWVVCIRDCTDTCLWCVLVSVHMCTCDSAGVNQERVSATCVEGVSPFCKVHAYLAGLGPETASTRARAGRAQCIAGT